MTMQPLQRLAARLQSEETAAAASEYAVVVAFIAAAIAAAVVQFDLGNLFEVVVAKVQSFVS